MQKRFREPHGSSPKAKTKKSRSRHSSPGDENQENDDNRDITKLGPKKTTYFFLPVDNLTKSTIKKSNTTTNASNILASTDENSHLSVTQSPRGIRTPTKAKPTPDPRIQEHQSSDDSFEGIIWKTSPRKVISANLNPVLSSPLKHAENSMSRGNDKSSTVQNEQTTSVLAKYGYGNSHLLTQTPILNRTHSDTSSTRSAKSQQLNSSPSLTRAKSSIVATSAPHNSKIFPNISNTSKKASNFSTNAKSIPSSQKNSNLNTWIDKFDMSTLILFPPYSSDEARSYTKSEVLPGELDQRTLVKIVPGNVIESHTEPTKEKHINTNSIQKLPVNRKESILSGIDFSDDFSDSSANSPVKVNHITQNASDSEDPFSDDDDELLAAIQTQVKTNAPSTNTQNENIHIKATQAGNTDDSNSSDFSDDDLNISLIEQVARQTQGLKQVTPLVSNDSCHGKTFKAGIMKLDELKIQDQYENKASYVNAAKLSFTRSDFLRYQIISIMQNKFKIKDRLKPQLILTVKNGHSEESKLIVRGEYTQLDLQENDVIHVILTSPENPKLVDDTHNLLIWNPDTLVASTTVAQQLRCPRKTVLTNKFKFSGETSRPFIIGDILHLVFQACFNSNKWTMEFMNDLLDIYIKANLLQIYSIGNIVDEIRYSVKEHFSYLKSWFTKYYKTSPSSIPTNKHNQNVMFSVSDALDIEENIWSPMFGLKGMVDVTLDAQLQDQSSRKRVLLPMEIKSGKEYIEHHAQSALYALLFKDRYDIDVLSFLLVYTKQELTKKFDINPMDLKSLVNLRNRLTKYLKENTRELPELIKSSYCDMCDVQKACMTINKLVENGDAEDSGINPDLYKSMTNHLEEKQVYQQFYDYWDELITKEESILVKMKKDLWVFTAKERELLHGKALCNLVIRDSNDDSDTQSQFKYTFIRNSKSEVNSPFQNSQISKFDRVIISDETGRFALAQGLITQIRPEFVTLTTSRRILNTDFRKNAFNGGSLEIQSVLHKTQRNSQKSQEVTTTYRIDKDDMFHGMGLARFNLLNLFLDDGDQKRRELIVDLRKPKFTKSISYKVDKAHFNSDQIKAFEKVLSSEDYSLILGMPGTGKTTVIAQLIKFLVDNNKTVLLASYTHSAVDNILVKVKDYGIDILRVGSTSRVHKDLTRYIPGINKGKRIETYEDFLSTYMNPPVVAVTCLGINDIAFNLRTTFDYCIIDEASQVSMPVSLGPLRFCDKFVLVGDHFQLPPLVNHPSPDVKKGLSQSLFKILADKHPQSVVELTYQYRMCEEIMMLSNVLVYELRLKCGSENVANQFLSIPYPEKIQFQVSPDFDSQLKAQDLWMNLILEKSNKVIFLNHDNLPGLERTIGDKVENPTEAGLVWQIVNSLTLCGVLEKNIGVMSLYRHQLRALNRLLMDKPDVEVLTADQFQGRDKDCVIISLVKSNKEKKVGDLLKEWRRVNVAITRSRSKLIILGSKSTISSGDSMKVFIDILQEKGWIYDLPKDADKFYSFPFSSQASNTTITQRTQVQSQNRLTKDSKIVKNNPIIRNIIEDMTS